jgi:hypothetical protein
MSNRAAMVKDQRPWRGPRVKKRRSRRLRMVIDRLMAEERSLSWLAVRIGVSRQALAAWEDIPDDHLPQVARVMGLSESELA